MLRELQPCRNAARCRRTHNDLPCGPVHSRTHPQSGNATRCERSIQAMEFHANGDLLATAKRNGKVEVWQVPHLNLVRTFSVGPSLQPRPASPDDAPPDPQGVSVTFAHNLPR